MRVHLPFTAWTKSSSTQDRCLLSSVVKYWNRLPAHLIFSPSVSIFKNSWTINGSEIFPTTPVLSLLLSLLFLYTVTADYICFPFPESRRLSKLVRFSRRQYQSTLFDDVKSYPRRFFTRVRIVALRPKDGAVLTDSSTTLRSLINVLRQPTSKPSTLEPIHKICSPRHPHSSFRRDTI